MECLDGYIKTTNIPGSCAGCAFIKGCANECEGQDYIFLPKSDTLKYYEENGKKYIRVANGKPSNSWQPCSGCAFDTPLACTNQCDGNNYIFIETPMKTPEIHEVTHHHHAVWRVYTESLLAGQPKQVEYRASVLDFWINASVDPSWNVDFEYRIKQEPKLFWYMKGEKIVEYVEPDVKQEQCIVEICLNGIRSCYQTFATRDEASAVARKLTNTFVTLKVK